VLRCKEKGRQIDMSRTLWNWDHECQNKVENIIDKYIQFVIGIKYVMILSLAQVATQAKIWVRVKDMINW